MSCTFYAFFGVLSIRVNCIFTDPAETFSIESPSLPEFGMVLIIEIGCVQNCHKAVEFLYKNEFFDISQLLSKLRKYSFGSKLIIFGLKLLRLSVFKIPRLRAPKRPILAQFFQALWQFYARPISIICIILDSGGKGLSIKNVSAK